MSIKETFWTFLISTILLGGGWIVMHSEPRSESYSDQLSFGLALMGAGIFIAAGLIGMTALTVHWIGRLVKKCRD